MSRLDISFPIVNGDKDLSKKRNAFIAKHLGPKFSNRFRQVNYKIWVGPYENEIKRFCYIGRSLADNLVDQYHGAADLIDEALKDGLDHLVPIILATQKKPCELKKILGKSIWKRICGNSLTRNKLLAHNVVSKCQEFPSVTMHWLTTKTKPKYLDLNAESIDYFDQMLGWPSTLLSRHLHQDFPVKAISWVVTTKKLVLNRMDDVVYRLDLFNDTLRMATRLGCSGQPIWSRV